MARLAFNLFSLGSFVQGVNEGIGVVIVRQRMGNTLMAIDACLAPLRAEFMKNTRLGLLSAEVHKRRTVAIATFLRIGFLHCGPDVVSQLQPTRLEFFPRVDSADEPVKQFVRGTDLADYFVPPFLGNVAVGTGCSYPGTIAVVNGFLVFDEHIAPHHMAGDAEFLGVGELQTPVEATPKQHAADKHGGDGSKWIRKN